MLDGGLVARCTIAVLLAVPGPVTAQPAVNRMIALTLFPPRGAQDKEVTDAHSALHCTADRRRCAQAIDDAGSWTLAVYAGLPDARRPAPIARHAVPAEDRMSLVRVWPHLVVEGAGGREIYGVETSRSTGFSGGGATATTLSLVTAGAPSLGRREPVAMTEIANVPGGFSAMIRACFGARDMKRRAGACHDEYAMDATLTLDPPAQTGKPRFRYTARAKTFPGRVSRTSDSLSNPPLTKKDLIWVVDRACSYHRALAMNAETGRYAFDIPPPECEDYAEQ